MKRIFAMAIALMLPMLLAVPVQAQDGYRIRPGDVLRIEVLEDPGLNRSALVSPDGRVNMPLAGVVVASGRTVEEVQTDLATRLAGNFAAAPSVFVSLERVGVAAGGAGGTGRLIEIYATGEVAKAGLIQARSGTTLLQAVALMGGFTRFAATKRIQLRRGDQTWTMSYDDIVSGASAAGNTVLRNGDVILVPQRKLFE